MRSQETDQEDGTDFITDVSQQQNTANHQEISGGSTKRKLLFSSSTPMSKKPNLSLSPPPSSSGVILDGYRKIQLPPTTLRPTISLPVDSICQFSNPQSPENLQRTTSDPSLISSQSPENYRKIMPAATATESTPCSLPPRRPVIRRKVSDAMSAGKIGSDLCEKQSPTSMELKKIKKNLRQMSQWFSEALQMEDDENEQGGCENNQKAEIPKEKECPEAKKTENEIDEEAVSVSKTEECLIIKFKCACTKAYHILLSGDSCYYKLM